MGRRGPVPRPAAVALLAGETRPSRVNFEAPIPRQEEPDRPRGMDSVAKAVWDHVLREMRSTGIILGADRDVLRAYCEAVSSYTRNIALLTRSGSVIRGSRERGLVVNPLHRVVREEREAIRLLARELGLSPAARAALRVDAGAASAEMDDVLGPPLRLLGRTGTDDGE